MRRQRLGQAAAWLQSPAVSCSRAVRVRPVRPTPLDGRKRPAQVRKAYPASTYTGVSSTKLSGELPGPSGLPLGVVHRALLLGPVVNVLGGSVVSFTSVLCLLGALDLGGLALPGLAEHGQEHDAGAEPVGDTHGIAVEGEPQLANFAADGGYGYTQAWWAERRACRPLARPCRSADPTEVPATGGPSGSIWISQGSLTARDYTEICMRRCGDRRDDHAGLSGTWGRRGGRQWSPVAGRAGRGSSNQTVLLPMPCGRRPRRRERGHTPRRPARHEAPPQRGEGSCPRRRPPRGASRTR